MSTARPKQIKFEAVKGQTEQKIYPRGRRRRKEVPWGQCQTVQTSDDLGERQVRMGSLEVCGKKLTTDEKEESGSDRGVDSKQALPVYKWSKITEPFITACKGTRSRIIHISMFEARICST